MIANRLCIRNYNKYCFKYCKMSILLIWFQEWKRQNRININNICGSRITL
jgi:hypothetical protein